MNAGRLRRALASASWGVTKQHGASLRWRLVALGLWPLLVAPGFVMLERYTNTPGRAAEAPATWPAELPLARASGRDTLVMLAHPRCPCTRASLSELARLMARIGEHADAVVLFVDPMAEGWEHTDLWRQAEAIPGVRVLTDRGGEISSRFGAYTSGQTLLYDASGALVFAGGITAARGHEGDNQGRLAIAGILNGEETPAASSNVFGCALREPEETK